ncbi:PstS family phosphate ABC transporter substrate-binding protein [Candidatus Magnetaquicoccus inordinatus]|uniref:PstS family phosphate ABC transporter substrate-binding protein n=1 Tax=Candidatus Magnetaquicoccus inordinatus TaxID=2496818 RepID=UPI00187D5DD5|nr:PstS family phosphate ABC transporter substrate-binding protein [Candidatus Magnetaquicoccus inordinatus]
MNKQRVALLTAALFLFSSPLLSATSMIQNKGSDTLVNVAQALAEAYRQVKPDVAIAVTGGGSGTGIAALINGTVDIANSSRVIEEKEIKLAEKKGSHPQPLIIAYDALAVFVHKNNPMEEISLQQLAAMYGDGGTINRWPQLAVEVPGCQKQKIILLSRQNNSGTYEYFREAVLRKNDFVLGTHDMHGSKDVVDLVGKTPCAIGYSGMAYASKNTKMLRIKVHEQAKAVPPTVATSVDKSYPIARPLFMYTNGAPSGEIKAYLDWVMSAAGQCLISKKGYAPVHELHCPP